MLDLDVTDPFRLDASDPFEAEEQEAALLGEALRELSTGLPARPGTIR